MLSVRDLRAMRGAMTLEAFTAQLGPFVLIRKPPDAVESARAMALAARGTVLLPHRRAVDGVSLLFAFEDLEISTLPPVGAEDVLTVGRLPDNDVVIDHTSVSKRHAEVRWQQGRCTVVDLGSTNGTLVNDAPVQTRAALRDGDIVTFGDVRFCFLLTPSLYRFLGHAPRRPSSPEMAASGALSPDLEKTQIEYHRPAREPELPRIRRSRDFGEERTAVIPVLTPASRVKAVPPDPEVTRADRPRVRKPGRPARGRGGR